MEKPKNIIFVCYGLGIGGIEKCLVNLLNAIPKDKYNIDVLLMNPIYNLKKDVNGNVNFIDSYKYVMNTTDTLREIKQHGGIIKQPVKFFEYVIFRIITKLRLNNHVLFHRLPKTYDIAVAYSQNDNSPYYVIDKIAAKKKVLWYHNGAYEKEEKLYIKDKKYYSKFDNVVAVSTDCYKMLKNKFDFRSNQLIVLQNICDKQYIEKKADETLNPFNQEIPVHIVTVARLSSEKGADMALDACIILANKGYNFCWHWVGDGADSKLIQDKINEYKMPDYFILEGNKINPYPYIKNCSVYVQPSYYEAYSTTITEAKILRKPIVTTDVGGMRDQIVNNLTGIITSISAESIAQGIEKLLINEDLQKTFTDNLSKEGYEIGEILKQYENTVLK